MRKGRWIVALIGAVVVLGAAAAIALTTARATRVQVADVLREDLSVLVSASGEVEEEGRVDVHPPAAGTLASVEVTEGARVVAGQVLARMDAEPLEVQASQAEAAYAGALAQREAVSRTVPGSVDREAAAAGADAARAVYQVADARYQAALAGAGAPSPEDRAQAEAALAAAEAGARVAQTAYENFHTAVYLPTRPPRPADMEIALATLSLARDQAAASLLAAQQGLAALLATSDNSAAVAAAKTARDQAYAAWLGAVAQQNALARASSVGGALESANAAIEAAAAARALANDALARATIVAPADGIVLFGTAGAVLSASSGLAGFGAGATEAGGADLAPGSSVSSASAIFSIVSFDTLAFTALVDETDIVRVELGMPAVITLDGLPDEELEARVASVGIRAVTTPTGGTAFPVRLTFHARTLPVLLGMNGSVEIGIETIGDVVTIPVEALFEEDAASYVYVVRDGRARRIEIEPGRFTDTRVEVRSGLSQGDVVIVSGVSGLEDGSRVQAE
ncbi:MAG: efflux RND transporter periplasmic adaptor subunit [Coriobacteriia bacterium]